MKSHQTKGSRSPAATFTHSLPWDSPRSLGACASSSLHGNSTHSPVEWRVGMWQLKPKPQALDQTVVEPGSTLQVWGKRSWLSPLPLNSNLGIPCVTRHLQRLNDTTYGGQRLLGEYTKCHYIAERGSLDRICLCSSFYCRHWHNVPDPSSLSPQTNAKLVT